ncbi:hypothetical protein BH10PLA2_BH10PLA2_27170 [soil metagenome]
MKKFSDLTKDLVKIVALGQDGNPGAYDEPQFRALVTREIRDLPNADFDYAGLPEMPFWQKVDATVEWTNRFGEPQLVVWLARILSVGRPLHKGLERILNELEAAIAGPALHEEASLALPPLPQELRVTLDTFDPRNAKPKSLAPLRLKLRNKVYDALDLPGRFHLSESTSERLAAILALEAVPDAGYLRWLSERVIVEQPLLGFVAGQAMITAARNLERKLLSRVRAAAQWAEDCLKQQESEASDVEEYEARNRLEQLNTAQKMIARRTGKAGSRLILPDDFEQFLAALIGAFTDHAKFVNFCDERLRLKVDWLGIRPEDPLEYGVIKVVLTATEPRIERDLVRAASQELEGIQLFSDLLNKYPVTVAG